MNKKFFPKALIFASAPLLLVSAVPPLCLVGCAKKPDFVINSDGDSSITLPAGNVTGEFKFKILYDSKDVFHITKFEKVEILQNDENEVKISPTESTIPTIKDNQFSISIAFKQNPQKNVSKDFQIRLTYINTDKTEDERLTCVTPSLNMKYVVPSFIGNFELKSPAEQTVAYDDVKDKNVAKYQFWFSKDQKIDTITAKIIKSGTEDDNIEFYVSSTVHGDEIPVEWQSGPPGRKPEDPEQYKYIDFYVAFKDETKKAVQHINKININFGNGCVTDITSALTIKPL